MLCVQQYTASIQTVQCTGGYAATQQLVDAMVLKATTSTTTYAAYHGSNCEVDYKALMLTAKWVT
jgi:hypothetical protein